MLGIHIFIVIISIIGIIMGMRSLAISVAGLSEPSLRVVAIINMILSDFVIAYNVYLFIKYLTIIL